VRLEISDTESSRFTDAQLLILYKKAISRAEKVLIRLGSQIVKQRYEITTVIDQAKYSLPSDFLLDISLYNDSGNHAVIKESELAWEVLGTDYNQAAKWIFFNESGTDKLWLKGTPSTAQTLVLWYYKTCSPAAMTTASSMPWSDRLNDVIEEYVALRAKNIDEADVSYDMQLLQDLETRVQDIWMPLAARITEGVGWM
jgi:hypothetical protein